MAELDFKFPVSSFTFEGGATSSTNSRITSGRSRNEVSVSLPVGENVIRVTALVNAEAKARVVVTYKGRAEFINEWRAPGLTGFVIQAPNDDPNAWLAFRSDTPGVLFGVSIFNIPPLA